MYHEAVPIFYRFNPDIIDGGPSPLQPDKELLPQENDIGTFFRLNQARETGASVRMNT